MNEQRTIGENEIILISVEGKKKKQESFKSLYLAPLVAGAVAGVVMVAAVYPLDTLKTRLQAAHGFKQAGGFHGIYKGLLTLLSGAIPINSFFFVTFEFTKHICEPFVPPEYIRLMHMCAASFCRVLTSVFRVPIEIAKQRKQACLIDCKGKSSLSVLLDAYRQEGVRRGLYRGFASTVLRDLPYSFIELPTWEVLKEVVKEHNDGVINSFESSFCAALAAGVAATATTPLDLAKTRIMLADSRVPYEQLRIRTVLGQIYAESGVRGLFAGATPRITMITLGGFVFISTYIKIRRRINEYINES